MEVGRPETKTQKSRKSKKAWRKNIDLGEIEQGLDSAREYERAFGVKESQIAAASDDALFTVDADGDAALKTRRERAVKPLKMDEILAKKYTNETTKKTTKNTSIFSNHPGLSKLKQPAKITLEKKLGKTDKKKHSVSLKELERLKRLAGHTTDKLSLTQAVVENSGFESGPLYDAWGAEEENTTGEPKIKTQPLRQKNKKFDNMVRTTSHHGSVPTAGSFISNITPSSSYIGPKAAPETLREAPVRVHDPEQVGSNEEGRTIKIPDAGKSYNPTIEDWAALIEREHGREAKREEERKALEAERAKIQLLMDSYDDNGELSDSEDESEEEEEEEEEDDDEDSDKTKDKTRLSVNPPVKAKKKTRAQLNRQKRHQDKLRLEAQLKRIRLQLKQIEAVPTLLTELEKQVAEATAASSAREGRTKNYDADTKRRRVTLKKHERIVQMPLEIKLSDELSDSLRSLRPEGNLALERFRSFQERGLIEVRGDTMLQKRKATFKEVEKLTYKYLFD